jgi:beta-galactosidase
MNTNLATHAFLQDPRIWYGGDYNPEQWPPEVWQEDVRLMQAAGVNLVSVGIFSWAYLEPRSGHYEFGWLDEVLDLLHQHGVQACLATATASPPPWLARRHPESLPVTADGVTLWPGSRQAYCPHSSAYRKTAADLVTRLADRYRHHPALAIWHINNEYGCHVNECFCNQSAAAFREWLRRRYGTLDALNAAWGTAFWSQRYDEWDEINPPRRAPTFINPTQQLDWRRFSSDSILELHTMEREILQRITPGVPMTTNFMGFFKPLDYRAWAAEQDIISLDSYPDPYDPWAPAMSAAQYDITRSLGDGRPWMLMEQVSSQVNWRPRNALKQPGQMRLWSLQAVARGARAVMFFQWRAAKAGAEKFHGALVPHVGVENSRVWREVSALGNELKEFGVVAQGYVEARVGILVDWQSWWALEQDSKPSTDVKFLEQVQAYYGPLYAQNITVDFVFPDSDLWAYQVLLVPSLYLVTDETAAKLERYVANGGVLVLSFFSGIVDENEHIRLGGYPAPFRKFLGIRVEEFAPMGVGQVNGVRFSDGSEATCDLWADVIDLEGAQALATFTGDFYAGKPAVTEHAYGHGRAIYIGTRLASSDLAGLLGRLCAEAGVHAPLAVPQGVEVVARRGGDAQRYLFVLNHRPELVAIPLPTPMRDLLSGDAPTMELSLDAYGAAILTE